MLPLLGGFGLVLLDLFVALEVIVLGAFERSIIAGSSRIYRGSFGWPRHNNFLILLVILLSFGSLHCRFVLVPGRLGGRFLVFGFAAADEVVSVLLVVFIDLFGLDLLQEAFV